MKKFLIGLLISLLILSVIYLFGPKYQSPNLVLTSINYQTDLTLTELADSLHASEQKIENIKSGNEAEIVFATDTPTKTPYVILYLPGFSATKMEGEPVHRNVAKAMNCNLLIARLADHGIDTDKELLYATPNALINSARQYISLAKNLGDSLILMGTSTGGTLILALAADEPKLAAQVLYSPNIEIKDPSAKLLSKQWGLQIGRLVVGDQRAVKEMPDSVANYWHKTYSTESLVYLQSLLDQTMSETQFSRIKTPTFMGYYYKDPVNQDNVVSVDAMEKMFDQLGTPENQKIKVAFPEAGDHVIASKMKTNTWQEVEMETLKFLRMALTK
jgi:esterase/lipase